MKKVILGVISTLVLMTSANAVNYENDIAPTVKFITEQKQKNAIYQDFIWEQEKLNSALVSKITEINSNFKIDDIYRLNHKISDLEDQIYKLKRINDSLESRLKKIESKVK
jgi:predicted RNase H-like nuclease (RuvC/YqgF family)